MRLLLVFLVAAEVGKGGMSCGRGRVFGKIRNIRNGRKNTLDTSSSFPNARRRIYSAVTGMLRGLEHVVVSNMLSNITALDR